jgi:hypothetical protein
VNTPHHPRAVALAVLAIALLAGCDDSRTTRTSNSSVSYQAQGLGNITADDFDLGTVVAKLALGDVSFTDFAALEQYVNDPANGINNVDLDKDKTVDAISVREQRDGDKRYLVFAAIPSSTKDEGSAENIATLTLTQTATGQVDISAGYANTVQGYDSTYYHQQAALRNALFFSMYFNAMRPMYVYHSPYAYYHARPYLGSAQRTQVRTTYSTQTRISPVARSTARPASFVTARPTTATVQRQQAAARMATRPSSLGGATQGNRDYGVRSATQPRSQGTSFRPSAPAPRPSYSAPAPRPSFGGGGGFRMGSGRRR